MSIFSFIKDVGQKLVHHDTTASAVAPNGKTLADEFIEQIQKMNLGIQNPNVKVKGDKAIIEGDATSRAAVEKAILAVGNTAGISQVETRMKIPADGVESRFYTVKSGDTLSKISKEMYGNANRYNEILEANRPMLKDADHIYPGQQLRIPQDQKQAA